MFWLVKVYIDDGTHYICVARASSEAQAEYLARRFYQNEGEIVECAEAEMFNSFEHGDTRSYELV